MRKRKTSKNPKRMRSESENFENFLSESEAKRHGNFLSESEAKAKRSESTFRFFRFFAFFRIFAFFALSLLANFFVSAILFKKPD
jgi:hypothetical protein